jgi:hypothetical protein
MDACGRMFSVEGIEFYNELYGYDDRDLGGKEDCNG